MLPFWLDKSWDKNRTPAKLEMIKRAAARFFLVLTRQRHGFPWPGLVETKIVLDPGPGQRPSKGLSDQQNPTRCFRAPH